MQLMGEASALLFPIDWPEPFGLVMIEAMSAGTPVLAFRQGSVPEVVDDGVTGVIVDGVDEAVSAVERVVQLDRRAVRARFEQRFSVQRMARDYLRVYEAICDTARKSAAEIEELAAVEESAAVFSASAYKQ
jgi:glycosyltransferase involved in cell wall biosynthesis